MRSAYDAGDYDGALRNSNIAKCLNVASILCGIVFIIILAKESELLWLVGIVVWPSLIVANEDENYLELPWTPEVFSLASGEERPLERVALVGERPRFFFAAQFCRPEREKKPLAPRLIWSMLNLIFNRRMQFPSFWCCYCRFNGCRDLNNCR